MTRVKQTTQPLEVGYANRTKKGGMWRFALYAGLSGFDLTTSARWFEKFSGDTQQPKQQQFWGFQGGP